MPTTPAAQEWQQRAAASPILPRLRIPGPLTGPALAEQWLRTDLLVLVSRVETFGLVVTEAFAHGIPAVVGAGTGAVEALAGDGVGPPPGAAANPADPDAIAATLRGYLTDEHLRADWRHRALARRERLRPWSATARDGLAAVGGT
jgi:glycosyltransferase involved in cell wall biosynthesis